MDHTRPTTLADVAKRAGVSVATASRVLNGSPHKVSAGLAAKVRAIADELRYAPNAQAQGLARSTSRVVALLLHDITDPYFGQIAQGVLAEAAERDVCVVIAETGIDPDNERDQLASLGSLRPRAAIMVGSRTTETDAEQRLSRALEDLRAIGTAVVNVGQPSLPGSCVHPLNREGAKELATHLAGLGHRRFALVTGPASLRVVAERREGFVDGLPVEAGVEIIDAPFSRDGGHDAGMRFAAMSNRASAVFVTSDVMASGFYAALRESGLSIPEDVSVAGFDDVPVAADLYPALTTVRLPLSGMGAQALRLALDGEEEQTVTIEPELIPRASTARA
ncbi:LacI family DNA-binding transcriptional regulator [Stackebrandtia nassauensis]|uniref:Transcriptional regulator, LacI family n=1 Tax=Stackebrandtia nassauensis (strain DSM 44728 / CIP 108903 / NRRL B-16338 / NBRC 102104 / LLR-40K-21) TaxID=446470 RepID=D3QA37_STANL|nr:LacI family DNA-binding transcriptional regulator [Stackebrandtia nassauensis]ADD40749.1 transcriptional regulator, LacI family [Stackebrandtia nassauensis DSM 44728]